MLLELAQCDGIAPAIKPRKLATSMAQTALDCRLRSGSLVPIRGNTVQEAVGASGYKGLAKWEYETNWLTCAAAGDTTPANWVALTDPGFMIEIDGTEYEVAPDFTGATTMELLASELQKALRALTENAERVVWDTDHFVFYTSTAVAVLAAPDDGGWEDISGAGWLNGAAGTVENTAFSPWLTWANLVHVVRSAIAGDQYARIYYTGDGAPKVKGYSAGETDTYDLKIPRPELVPILEINQQWAFSKFRGWIEVASTGNAHTNVITTEAVDRNGLEHTFSLRFNSKDYLNGIEYRLIVEGWCTSLDTPAWITCYTAHSVAVSSVLNYSWMNWWTEPTDNGVHTGGTYSAEDEDNGSTLKLKLFDRLVKLTRASIPSGSPPNYPIGETVTYLAECRIVTEGLLPATPSKSTPLYAYAYVTKWGEEGPASDPSLEIEREIGDNVKVWMPTTDPARGVLKKRVYRTSADGRWRWVKDVLLDDPDVANTLNANLDGTDPDDDGVVEWEPATDKIAANSVGEVLEDDTDEPDDALANICAMPNGVFAASKGREVWLTKPHRPSVWPESYRFSFHDEVVAIEPTGNELFVLTKRQQWLLSGSDPQYMTQVLIPHDDVALGAGGVTRVRSAVMAPGADGLSAFAGAQATVATEAWYDSPTWLALSPESFVANADDGAYLAFNSSGGLSVAPGGDLSAITKRSDTTITALYREPANDAMYAIDGSNIVLIDDPEADARTFTWKSRLFVFLKPVRWVAARLRADSYAGAVVLKLYGDGVLKLTYTPADAEAVKIPRTEQFRRWELEVVSSVVVHDFAVATSMADLRNGQ